MKKARVLAINTPTGKNPLVIFTLDVKDANGVNIQFVYDLSSAKKMLQSIEKEKGLPSGTFVFQDFVGADFVGNWETYAAGDTRVLDAQHPMVTEGASVDLKVDRNGKSTLIKTGEKAEVGDVYTYPKDGVRRDGVVQLNVNAITLANLTNRIELLAMATKARKLKEAMNTAEAPTTAAFEDSLDI